MARLSIEVSKEFHQNLRVHTAYTGQNISDFVPKAIYERIQLENTPNKETLKALAESRVGKNLNGYNSWSDMFSKLEKEAAQENDI